MRYKLPLLQLFCWLGSISVTAQDHQPALTEAAKKAVIVQLVTALEKNYVFADTAIQMGNYIQQRFERGLYDTITDQRGFARVLTTDLRRVYNDRHIRVIVSAGMGNKMAAYDNEEGMAENYSFAKIAILDSNIGYVYFNRFFSVSTAAKETVQNVFGFLRHTRAIIFDLRDNGGGEPAMVQLLCSYLFNSKTLINTLYERRNGRTEQYWTEPTSLSAVFNAMPVYILVSHRTFSAAEEFAYDLQSLHRGTVIGEPTGGGAHPVEEFDLTYGFTGIIPYARAFNPVTGTNWEGTGVMPDIQVAPDSALPYLFSHIVRNALVIPLQKE